MNRLKLVLKLVVLILLLIPGVGIAQNKSDFNPSKFKVIYQQVVDKTFDNLKPNNTLTELEAKYNTELNNLSSIMNTYQYYMDGEITNEAFDSIFKRVEDIAQNFIDQNQYYLFTFGSLFINGTHPIEYKTINQKEVCQLTIYFGDSIGDKELSMMFFLSFFSKIMDKSIHQ